MDVLEAQWEELRRLPRLLEELAEQATEVTEYAVRWVACRDGFEPSPVCLLRPLAEAMGVVRAAFEQAERAAVAELVGIAAGVEVAAGELRAADAGVAARLPEVA